MLKVYVDANPLECVCLIGDIPYRKKLNKKLLVPYCELEAIKWALEMVDKETIDKHDGIRLYSDNEMAVKCLRREYAIHKEEVRDYCFAIWSVIREKNLNVNFMWVARDKNKAGRLLG
jgi:ribonuclease HI